MKNKLKLEQKLITGLITDHNANVSMKFNEDDDFETRKAMSSALYVELFEILKVTTGTIDSAVNMIKEFGDEDDETLQAKEELVDFMVNEINAHTDRVNSQMNGFGLLPEQRQYELGMEFYADLYQIALTFIEKVSK